MTADLPADLREAIALGIARGYYTHTCVEEITPLIAAALARARAEGAREALTAAADELETVAAAWSRSDYAAQWQNAAGMVRARAARPLVPVAQPAEPLGSVADYERMLEVVEGYTICEQSGHDYQCRRCLVDKDSEDDRPAAPSPGADPATRCGAMFRGRQCSKDFGHPRDHYYPDDEADSEGSGWTVPRSSLDEPAAPSGVAPADPDEDYGLGLCDHCDDSPCACVAPAEPCIGHDPTCPCEDGDICHYVDDPVSGTKAMPFPSGVAPADTTEEPADG